MRAPADPFYALPSGEQVTRLSSLAREALPRFGLPPDAELEVVTERENAVFRASVGDGRTYAVRVHRAGYHSDGELRGQVAWAEALSADGVVTTAPVVRTVDGDVVAVVSHSDVPEPRQVTVLEWIEGDLLADAGGDEVEQYEQVGALMAALHEHSARWSAPAGFEALRWDLDGLLGEDPTWGRFWDASLLDEEGREVLAAFRSFARDQLESFGNAPDRFGLVHGDFLPENLLVAPDGQITLLDFDDSGYGWFLFDVATALVVPSLGEGFADTEDAFWRGYRSVRPMPDEHVARLPFFLALRGATYVGWMDTRSHTQFAKDMGPIVAAAALEAVRAVTG